MIPHSIHERVSRTDIKDLEILAFARLSELCPAASLAAMSNRIAAASFSLDLLAAWARVMCNQSTKLCLQIRLQYLSMNLLLQKELERLRRQVFWGEFLLIPAAVVRRLPQMFAV